MALTACRQGLFEASHDVGMASLPLQESLGALQGIAPSTIYTTIYRSSDNAGAPVKWDASTAVPLPDINCTYWMRPGLDLSQSVARGQRFFRGVERHHLNSPTDLTPIERKDHFPILLHIDHGPPVGSGC